MHIQRNSQPPCAVLPALHADIALIAAPQQVKAQPVFYFSHIRSLLSEVKERGFRSFNLIIKPLIEGVFRIVWFVLFAQVESHELLFYFSHPACIMLPPIL